MSAEGKKKRGVSGVSNAKNINFRYCGYPRAIAGTNWNYSLSTANGATDHPRLGGSRFLHAMAMGAKLPGFNPSHRAVLAADMCIEWLERCGARLPS